MELLQTVKEKHLQIANELFGNIPADLLQQIPTSIVWKQSGSLKKIERWFTIMYDQIICIGELISSRILSAWLQSNGNAIEWIDARSIIQKPMMYLSGCQSAMGGYK